MLTAQFAVLENWELDVAKQVPRKVQFVINIICYPEFLLQ